MASFTPDMMDHAGLGSDPMAAMLGGQNFLQDSTMAGMPLGDPNFMLPLMTANGALPMHPPPNNTVSAGTNRALPQPSELAEELADFRDR